MKESDQKAPTLGALSVIRIDRGQGPQRDGCGYGATSCDGHGGFAIGPAATDDVTPPGGMGYRLAVLGGTLPRGFQVPVGPTTSVVFGTEIFLSWEDGATDDQESFDFLMEVVAIDRAGNESAPQMVRIVDNPGGSCSTVIRPEPPGFETVLGVLTLTALLRRRRVSRK